MVMYGKGLLPGGASMQYPSSTTFRMNGSPIKDVLLKLRELNKFERWLYYYITGKRYHGKISIDSSDRKSYGSRFPLTCLDNNNVPYHLIEYGSGEDGLIRTVLLEDTSISALRIMQ